MSARSRVRERVAGVTGVRDLDVAEARIASLEVAVAENLSLEGPLLRMVAELERAVAGVVERGVGTEVRP